MQTWQGCDEGPRPAGRLEAFEYHRSIHVHRPIQCQSTIYADTHEGTIDGNAAMPMNFYLETRSTRSPLGLPLEHLTKSSIRGSRQLAPAAVPSCLRRSLCSVRWVLQVEVMESNGYPHATEQDTDDFGLRYKVKRFKFQIMTGLT